jgi:hypothetical protein
MTLVIAIVFVVWIGVALVALALCRAAAIGDRRMGGDAYEYEAAEPPPVLRVVPH